MAERNRRSSAVAAILAGIADALDLAREEAARLRDGRRTQTVTWRQLDDALAALRTRAARRRSAAGRLAPRIWPDSPRGRDHGRHRAGAFAVERGDDAGADMLFWAQASHATRSTAHRRDLARTP